MTHVESEARKLYESTVHAAVPGTAVQYSTRVQYIQRQAQRGWGAGGQAGHDCSGVGYCTVQWQCNTDRDILYATVPVLRVQYPVC